MDITHETHPTTEIHAYPCLLQLFTIAKSWKQPKCPSTNKWMKKTWYIYTTEFYAVVKKDGIMYLAGKRMELEATMLSEVRRSQKNKRCIVSLSCEA